MHLTKATLETFKGTTVCSHRVGRLSLILACFGSACAGTTDLVITVRRSPGLTHISPDPVRGPLLLLSREGGTTSSVRVDPSFNSPKRGMIMNN